jgi:hypothetical protein
MEAGICKYKNLTMAQHEDIFKYFPTFLQELKPERILEIGTGSGVFTMYIRDTLDSLNLSNTKIVTYDVFIHDTIKYNNIFENYKTIEYRIDNIFDESFKLIKPEAISDYIKQPGVTLVMCDGGYKRYEIIGIAPLLKVGDVIMGHDYIYDNKVKVQKFMGIWDCWHELAEEHISECCKQNNLVPYFQEQMAEVVWACRRKEK